jgi:pimeloyl-ACP methyl ester carboxylesterase
MGHTPQFLDVSGRRIAIISAQPEGVAATILWLPGFMSDMVSSKATAVAEWAEARGLGMLRFDYSGHGASEGDIAHGAIGDWLDEADAALARAEAPAILAGSSMGGWIALLLLRRIARRGGPAPLGAALIAPAWDMTEALMWDRATGEEREALLRDGVFHQPSDYSDRPYPIGRRLIEEGRNHLIGSAPFDPGCPVRILQGMQDADTPWERALELMSLLESDDIVLSLVKDAGHRLSRPSDLKRLLSELETLAFPATDAT